MNTVKISGIIILLFLTSSCYHYYYAPNMHNVPLFQQKEELHLDLSGSMGNEFTAFEVQAAFSVADNFALMGNGFMLNRNWDDLIPEDYNRGHLIEGGAGTFVNLDHDMVFEAYTGLGFGKIENGYENSTTSKLSFYRYFLQPSVGYTSDFMDVAVSLRLSGLRYNDIQFTGILEQDDQDQILYINRNPFSILVEPAVTLRGGWEQTKFQLQLGYSENVMNPDLIQERLNINFGIYFTISDKYRKKKSPSVPE